MDLEEKYGNLNEEVKSKTNKLKKLRTMIMEAKSELDDINKEHNRAKEGLLENIRENTKEKLSCCNSNDFKETYFTT